MPPKASAHSNNKKKSGKMKENSKANDRQEKEDAEKKLVDEFLATELGRSIGLTDERIVAKGGSTTPFDPDVPPCDGCAKNFSGTMQCSRCESVFYCGRDCQVDHWTTKHKTECKHLKERNDETAQRVLREFKAFRGWRSLDVAGAYKAAVRHGLHDKIRDVLQLDNKAAIIQRLQSGSLIISYTKCVLSVLFRGQRAEGRAEARSSNYDCVDGRRIKGYVTSHPDAMGAWLQASVEILRAVTDPATLRVPFLHNKLVAVARDVWHGWTMVFTSATAARAILSPFQANTMGAMGSVDGGGEEPAEQRRNRGKVHTRRIVKAVGEALYLVGNIPGYTFDPTQLLESNVNLVLAMVDLRSREYGIGIDVEGMLNLKGMMKKVFQGIAIPVAKRTIEKGGALNKQEANAVLAVSSRAMGLH